MIENIINSMNTLRKYEAEPSKIVMTTKCWEKCQEEFMQMVTYSIGNPFEDFEKNEPTICGKKIKIRDDLPEGVDFIIQSEV